MRMEQGDGWTIHLGDCLDVLPGLEAQSVHCVVTSPPYFCLRDYGQDGQIGLEQTPAEYVAKLVQVFREVRRVLRDDGVVWLNLGDSYASGEVGRHDSVQVNQGRKWSGKERRYTPITSGLMPKSLLGIPWRVAFALQDDGWILRSDVIWAKPNPMPESVKDRPTKSHEYVFLLAKQGRYWYDADAVREEANWRRVNNPDWQYQRAKTNAKKGCNNTSGANGGFTGWRHEQGRNRRSVWTVATAPFTARKYGFEVDHFAVMPPKLVEPCILAGCPGGGVVLDPFCGAGTTGYVAVQQGRQFIGIELNADYVAIANARIADAAAQKRLPFDVAM